MHRNEQESRASAAWLLVIPGSTFVGTGVGLAFGAPGPGLTTGLGAGVLLWGILVALGGSRRAGR
jgi:uncharacterized membrane protein YedE/YeeE